MPTDSTPAGPAGGQVPSISKKHLVLSVISALLIILFIVFVLFPYHKAVRLQYNPYRDYTPQQLQQAFAESRRENLLTPAYPVADWKDPSRPVAMDSPQAASQYSTPFNIHMALSSWDGSCLAYIDQSNAIFYQQPWQKEKKLAARGKLLYLAPLSNNLYYIKGNDGSYGDTDDLYVYKDGLRYKLASNVSSYVVSVNESYVAYCVEETFYLLQPGKKAVALPPLQWPPEYEHDVDNFRLLAVSNDGNLIYYETTDHYAVQDLREGLTGNLQLLAFTYDELRADYLGDPRAIYFNNDATQAVISANTGLFYYSAENGLQTISEAPCRLLARFETAPICIGSSYIHNGHLLQMAEADISSFFYVEVVDEPKDTYSSTYHLLSYNPNHGPQLIAEDIQCHMQLKNIIYPDLYVLRVLAATSPQQSLDGTLITYCLQDGTLCQTRLENGQVGQTEQIASNVSHFEAPLQEGPVYFSRPNEGQSETRLSNQPHSLYRWHNGETSLLSSTIHGHQYADFHISSNGAYCFFIDGNELRGVLLAPDNTRIELAGFRTHIAGPTNEGTLFCYGESFTTEYLIYNGTVTQWSHPTSESTSSQT